MNPPPGDPNRRLDRRSFLRLGAGAAAAASTGTLLRGRYATAAPGDDVFAHGVASGDPSEHGVVLWTRVAPALGAGAGPVQWQVAADEGFSRVVRTGQATADPARDSTVHVDVDGLAAGQSYWYRFRVGGARSPVGRTRTLPAAGAHVERLRLGVVTCTELEWGYFGAYRHLAGRDDIDAVLFLGDYLYEYAAGDYGGAFTPGPAIGRTHEPAWETTTLADYRLRHANYRRDPDLQALHARHPVIAVWDDHEICNDAWREGAQNHTADEGDYQRRFRAARQAYLEWLPMRRPATDTAPLRIHRSLRVGDLAQLWMLDERTHRDQHAQAAFLTLGSVDPAIDAPGRSILGDDQRNWLLDGMSASGAAWKLVGNQVPFAPYRTGPDLTSPVRAMLAEASLTLPVRHPVLETDTWTGYAAEQRLIVEALATRGVADVVILTGDAHASYANEVPLDPDSYRFDPAAVAVEFIAPSVTSPSLSTVIESRGLTGASELERVLAANVATANPWIKYYEGRMNGYGLLDLTHEGARYEFWHLADPLDPTAVPARAASFLVERGTSAVRPG